MKCTSFTFVIYYKRVKIYNFSKQNQIFDIGRLDGTVNSINSIVWIKLETNATVRETVQMLSIKS